MVSLQNVFLAGGFGESKFLQEELETSLCLRERIQLRRPETSWTSVVRGAVICGVEKDTTANLAIAKPSPKFYGIAMNEEYSKLGGHEVADITLHHLTRKPLATGRMRWLINKGDLILSDGARTEEIPVTIIFQQSDPRERKMFIYSYEDDDYLPTKLQDSIHGKLDLTTNI